MNALFLSRISKTLMCLICLGTCAFGTSVSFAQEQIPQQPEGNAPLVQDVIDGVISQSLVLEEEEVVEDAPAMDSYGQVRIRALDKITARTETIELKIGDMVEFGALTITGKACRKSAPIESPESAAFLQVWEFPLGAEEKEIIDNAELRFSGWMFASSPGLSAMDHPIYDIWVLDCIGDALDETVEFNAEAPAEDTIENDGADIKDLDLLDAIEAETRAN